MTTRRRVQSQVDIVRELVKKGLVRAPISGSSTTTPIFGFVDPDQGEIGWSWTGNFNIIESLFTTGKFLKPGNGGIGLDASTAADGALLIGNSTGFTLATLTAGSGIAITNGAGSISIAQSGAPGGGSIVNAGVLTGSGGGTDYSTTSASFVDVDGTNLKVTLVIGGSAKFIIVSATFSLGASVITDGAFHARILAAGSTGGAQGCFVNNGTVNPEGQYTLYGVVANPPAGSQSISLQFKGDGVNAFVIKNPTVEGTLAGPIPDVIARMQYVVTN